MPATVFVHSRDGETALCLIYVKLTEAAPSLVPKIVLSSDWYRSFRSGVRMRSTMLT